MNFAQYFKESVSGESYNRNNCVHFKLKGGSTETFKVYHILLFLDFVKDLEKYKIVKHNAFGDSHFDPPIYYGNSNTELTLSVHRGMVTIDDSNMIKTAFTANSAKEIMDKMLELYDYLQELKASLSNRDNLKLDL